MLSTLTTKATVLTVNNHLDEIACRYKAEKYYADSNVIFYSMFPKEDISFLLEYTQVNGMVDLTDIEQYIKNHLFATAGINTTISKSELILAGKLGIERILTGGKELLPVSFNHLKWMNVCCHLFAIPMNILTLLIFR